MPVHRIVFGLQAKQEERRFGRRLVAMLPPSTVLFGGSHVLNLRFSRLHACAQVFGLLAEQEGRRFGRRMAVVLPPLAALLTAAAAAVSAASAGNAMEAEDAEEVAAAATGWQEPYAGLLLFERLTRQVRGFVLMSSLSSKLPSSVLAC